MRLLFIEDDPRMARFVAKGLQHESCAVDVVANGHDAVYQVKINDYMGMLSRRSVTLFAGGLLALGLSCPFCSAPLAP